MGSDNLFHKRKAKNAAHLKRRGAKRAPYDKVLIVCEGSKTEPNYFVELSDHYKLNSANIAICGDCGSAPISIVGEAQKRYRKEQQKGDAFDRVYCVFDQDTHQSYNQAISEINRLKPANTFFAITSVPCFEFWLLLHFEYTTRAFHGIPGGDSAGEQMVKELKKYIPNYAKGTRDHFMPLIDQLPQAKQHAQQVLQQSQFNGDNPSTRIHELVDYLQNLKTR